jgi:uncharacterized protein (DUF433 family)/DNA-binding transcriptional MerR regulator
MFPLTAFTTDTVARITGLSVHQLQRWDRTGFFVPSFADPERRRPYSRVYSFEDLVGLRTIAKLREQGVSFPALKRVRAFFTAHASPSRTNKDWANRRFYVVGPHVYFTHEDAVIAAKPLGQQIEPRILELGPIVNDVAAAVHRLPDRGPDQVGEVSRDRLILGGAPVIAGTRIATATIARFARHGYDTAAILAEYPRLRADDIDAAIAFERQRDTDGQGVTRAAG